MNLYKDSIKKKKHQQQQQQKNSVCTSTGKHFLSKHRTIKMSALIIKIETFHGFVIVLKAEQNLKWFSPFYAPDLFQLCLLFQYRNVAILFNYKVASGLNEQHGNLFKSLITGDKCEKIFKKYKMEFRRCHCGLTLRL